MHPLNIVLLKPEMPANTGNIGRSCVAVGARLHLIGPMGFSTEDKYVKRAGMDYWPLLDVSEYDSFEHFLSANNYPQLFVTSSKVRRCYTSVDYPPGAFILFGSESAGVPPDILARYPQTTIRIPMLPGVRCINLSSSAAVVIYEALRQQGFVGLN